MEQSPSWEATSLSASQDSDSGTRGFTTVFTTAHHLSLSWARWIQSTPSHLITLTSIIMLSYHLRLDLPNCLFPSGFLTKILHAFLISPMRSTFPAHLTPPLFYQPNDIWWSAQVMKLLIMQFSPASPTSSLLGPNILLSTLFSNTLNLCSYLNIKDQTSHPYKTTGKKE
jgi:hypothetical protein